MESKKDLTEAFLNAYQLMQRYSLTWYRKNFGGLDPWQGQGRILSTLRRRQSITQKELGLMLELRPQSLGELLQKLEGYGYIRRYRSATDKRALIVELTDKGEIFQLKRPDYDELFIDLDRKEKAELKKALEKVAERLQEQIDKEAEDEFY